MATTNDSISDDDILPEAQVFRHRYKNVMKDKNLAFKEMCKTFNSGVIDKPSATTVQESTAEFVARVAKTLPTAKPKRTRKGNKQKKKAAKQHSDDEEEEDNDDDDVDRSPKRRNYNAESTRNMFDSPEVKLPKAVSKSLRDLERQEARERRRMQAETERIMSSDDDESPVKMPKIDESGSDSKQITLKVRYFSDIKRINVLSDEKFSSISAEIGRIFGLKVSEMMLCRGCDRINVSDTPLSLKLGIVDIIDCVPYVLEEQTADANHVRIQLQSWDSRKRVEMFPHKCGKLIDTMKKFAEQRNTPLEDLIFEFDGEKIEGWETPEDLDMEDGSCVDVKPKKSALKSIAESSDNDNTIDKTALDNSSDIQTFDQSSNTQVIDNSTNVQVVTNSTNIQVVDNSANVDASKSTKTVKARPRRRKWRRRY